jgi:hypothetical protein
LSFGALIAHKKKLAGDDFANPRPEGDFYPTPPEATEAFLRREAKKIKLDFGGVWDPACGAGAISKILESHGFEVYSSDLFDHGFGDTGIDFLKAGKLRAPAIITNPPYHKECPEKFIVQAKRLGAQYLALLLKSDYWNAGCRVNLWRRYPPSRCYPLGWRLDFTGGGGSFFNVDWWVWDWRRVMNASECRILPPLQRPDSPDCGVLL